MTVFWHVDDLKIFHMNGYVVGNLIIHISEKFRKEAELTIHRGKLHNYLGMNLDYRKCGKVKMDMTEHLEKILNYITRVNRFTMNQLRLAYS